MIKTVVFDFADTIASLSPSKELLVQTFIKEKINIEVPLKNIEETYFYIQNLYFYSSVNIIDSATKASFYEEFNKKIFSNLGLFHKLEPFIDDFFEYFSKNRKHWVLKKDVKEILDFIQTKNLKIGLISNFDNVLMNILEDHLGIKEYFSYIHISQDVGLEKPDVAFYENFLHKNHLNAEEILYVGDNYELDFLPTTRLGFKSILLDEQQHYLHAIKTLERIDTIIDLKGILQ